MAYINKNSDANGYPLTFKQAEELLSKYTKEEVLESEGFNTEEIFGITKLGLDKDEVKANNIDANMLSAIISLGDKINNTEDKEIKEAYNKAFKILKGLKPSQIMGIIELGLNRNQVLAKNFGEHTVLGIVAMILKDLPKNIQSKDYKKAILKAISEGAIQKGFKKIKTLDHNQTHEVVHNNVTPSQVLDPSYDSHTVLEINELEEQGNSNTRFYKIFKGSDSKGTKKTTQPNNTDSEVLSKKEKPLHFLSQLELSNKNLTKSIKKNSQKFKKKFTPKFIRKRRGI